MRDTGEVPIGVSDVPFSIRSLLVKDGRACVRVRPNSSDVSSDCDNRLGTSFHTKFGYIQTYIKVNCGMCDECVEQNVNEMMSRIYLEMKNHGNYGFFLTLTYNDDSLPLNEVVGDDGVFTGQYVQSVRLSDVQKFLKRLRANIDRKGFFKKSSSGDILNPLKYFCISEYGFTSTDHMRPHYHFMLFVKDIALNDLYDLCAISWCDYGFIELTPLVDERMRYCARTHATASRLFPNPPGSDKPFSKWSKGFGLPGKDDLSYIRENKSVRINDYGYPLPRYLKEKCFSADERRNSKVVRAYNGPVDDDLYKKFMSYMKKYYPRVSDPSLLSPFQVKRLQKFIDEDAKVNGDLFYKRFVLKRKN